MTSYYGCTSDLAKTATVAATYLLFIFPALSLIIDPIRVEVRKPPGTVVRGVIRLTNEKTKPVKIAVTQKDESARREEFPDWLQLDKNQITLEPSETGALGYAVTIPEKSSGLFLAKLSFSEQKETPLGMLGIQTKISIYLAAIVNGTEIYEAEIQSIRVMPHDPRILEVAINNTGNVYNKSIGRCKIVRRSTNEIVSEFIVNEQARAILPGKLTTVVGRMKHPLEPGSYEAAVSLPFPDKEHLLHKTVELQVPPSSIR